MDMFIEKIVRRHKSVVDVLLIFLIIIGAIGLSFLALIYIPGLSTILAIGIFYLAYILISKLNIEYEYAVTNGDLDIDKIINQRKRKRLYSGNCKEFEIVAKVNSRQYTRNIQECKNIKDYSSHSKNAEVWFISLRDEGKQTVILFEPNQQMIDNFKIFIPRKVFTE
ncbi:MAG: hypothetical protein GX227_03905 [Clostridiaceae bacterium]|nr:hypothetical protein [Clostridiaceae bacterium]